MVLLSETSPIQNNQWFETVQNYCLRSLLFIFARLLHQLRKSCKDLQLATPAFAQRDTYRKITQSVDSGLLWGVSKRALKRAARPFSKSRQKKHVDCWRHERYLSKHPLLSLNSRAMQSSLLDCLKSLSRSLMIHATVLSRPWPCSWVKDVQSVNQTHEIIQSNHLSFSKLRGLVAQRNFKRNLHCFRPLPPLVLLSETSPIQNNQWFETVQNYCLRSLLFIFARLLHQLRKSCKDLQLATPAFAQRDTYRKITQSVDSGLLWGVSKRALKRAARPFSKSRQKKHVDCWRHERYLSKHPLLSLNSRAMQSSLLDCLKSLSRSLMIHATVLSRPWPCS